MKDNFSSVAKDYLQFRPLYPQALYDFVYSHLSRFNKAWDVGTGNGQVAKELAAKFEHVLATDISEKQLDEAPRLPNIIYRKQAAEEPPANGEQFDLVMVAQAIHWFQFDAFYKNVRETLHPEGLFVVAGYGLLRINEEADKIIRHFYEETMDGFWDPERRYIDEAYQSIPFPFREIDAPQLEMIHEAGLEWLCGYIATWSAVTHFRKAKNEDPIPHLKTRLAKVLPPTFTVHTPVLLRAGRR